MTQHTAARQWDGWELWYFGSDYLADAGLPASHWATEAVAKPAPHLWVVASDHQPQAKPAPAPPRPARYRAA